MCVFGTRINYLHVHGLLKYGDRFSSSSIIIHILNVYFLCVHGLDRILNGYIFQSF